MPPMVVLIFVPFGRGLLSANSSHISRCMLLLPLVLRCGVGGAGGFKLAGEEMVIDDITLSKEETARYLEPSHRRPLHPLQRALALAGRGHLGSFAPGGVALSLSYARRSALSVGKSANSLPWKSFRQLS